MQTAVITDGNCRLVSHKQLHSTVTGKRVSRIDLKEELDMRLRLGMTFLALMLTGVLAVGCAPDQPAPTGGSTTPPPSTTTPSPSAPAMNTIVLKGQSHNASGNTYDKNWVMTCDLITAASGGRLELKPFSGGAIVPATEEFDAVEKGILDFSSNSPTYWKKHFPQAGPFSYRTAGLSPAEHLGWITSEEGSSLLERLVQGRVVVLPGTGNLGSPEIFMCTSKPITRVSDLNGLKMRGSGDGAEVLAKLGASMVFFSSTEVYESMQRGVIDAFEVSGPSFNWAYGMHEVGEYVYLSGVRQPTEYFPFFFSNSSWAKLTPDLQTLITEIAKGGPMRCYYEMAWLDTIYTQKMKDYGLTVEFMAKEIDDAMVAAAAEFYGEMSAKDPLYAEIITSMDAYKAAIRGSFERL